MDKEQELGRHDAPTDLGARRRLSNNNNDISHSREPLDKNALARVESTQVGISNSAELSSNPHASPRAGSTPRTPGRRTTDYLNDRQVDALPAAARLAHELGYPLNAHLTVHWAMTVMGDDPDGRQFARFRERFSKALKRLGIPFFGVWAREQHVSVTKAEHCHLVFHLPHACQGEIKWLEIENLARLILKRLSGCIDARMVKLTLPNNGDVRYLLKGSRPDVQAALQLKRDWRVYQGRIVGKRAGFTQNLGPAAHARYQRNLNISRRDNGGCNA